MAERFPFDVVGFDLDGTLVDTHRDLATAVNHALALAGRPPVAAETVRGLIGGGARAMLGRALDLTGGPVDPGEAERLHGALIEGYATHIADRSAAYPGAAAMLDALAARGVRLAVATNKREWLARRLLDALGLAPRFATVLGGDTLGPGRAKPAPDMLRAMGAGRAAFVGDSSFDLRAARAAGMPCVLASFGYADAPLAALEPDAVIDDFAELVPVLERIGGVSPPA